VAGLAVVNMLVGALNELTDGELLTIRMGNVNIM
jgi:hypothetical protein